MTMIERVARAIVKLRCARTGMGATDNCLLDPEELDEARAAIEAMREPTEAMIKEAAWEDGRVTARNVWQAMISEALNERNP